jgi:hypothetical protein
VHGLVALVIVLLVAGAAAFVPGPAQASLQMGFGREGASERLDLMLAGFGLPEVNGLSPDQVTAGELSFTLTVLGSGFVPGSTVLWNGESRDTGFLSPEVLTATVRTSDVLFGGTAYVSVVNPGAGGGTSPVARPFVVVNPVPEVAALSPDRVWAGSASFRLEVSGSRFSPTSVVQIAGIDQPTTFLDSCRVQAEVPVEALRYAAGLSVRVFTPVPGGGLSSPIFLWVYEDNVPPVTEAKGLVSLWNRKAVTLTLVATDIGRGVERTFYRLNQKAQYSVGTRVRIPAPADHSNDGVHVVQFFSIDAVLNWEEPPKEVEVGIDTTPPTTTVTSGDVLRGEKLFPRFLVYDRLSPQARDALLQIVDRKGSVVLRAGLGKPSTRVWHTGKGLVVDLPRGTYTMRVLAHDLAGNAQSKTKSGSLVVR